MSKPNKRSEQEQDKPYWENRRDGEVIAYGSKETMPTAAERKDMRLGGLKLYVNGKIYREDKKC
jgi:hypothetical protein